MPRYQRREGGHCSWDVDARTTRSHCAPGTTRKLEGSISVREPSGPSPIDAEGQGIDARGHSVRRYRTKARDKNCPISSTRSATPASPETLECCVWQRMGRPPKLTAAQQAEARRRRAEGATLAALARSYGVGKSTISRLTAYG
jgi:hypothetical protein